MACRVDRRRLGARRGRNAVVARVTALVAIATVVALGSAILEWGDRV